MTRCGVVLLVAITLAWGEDKGAEYNALLALDDFRLARQGKEIDYKALRERIATNLPKATRATQWIWPATAKKGCGMRRNTSMTL